ncbi:MAG TPA: YtxH domain-containing protein [Flavitalea sp.]|nr:YtxH domain-containing protein [Flavitalea sp.]HTF31116.1 YtxH domain-containing protein [Flavitalea sp.]
MSLQKIIIGTLSGLAAGLVIGILTAPDKGVETRRKITDSAEDLKNRLRRFKHTGLKELEELSNIFQNEVQGLNEDVRSRVLDLIEGAKSGINHIKKEVNSN